MHGCNHDSRKNKYFYSFCNDFAVVCFCVRVLNERLGTHFGNEGSELEFEADCIKFVSMFTKSKALS